MPTKASVVVFLLSICFSLAALLFYLLIVFKDVVLLPFTVETNIHDICRSSNQQICNIKLSNNMNNGKKTDEWSSPVLPEHLQGADQFNPELIQHIWDNWIIPPFVGPIHIGELQEKYSESGQAEMVDEYLNHTKGGFLVECGAADGLISSNSLHFELHRHWSGILIEANPDYFASLLNTRRHMFMLNACLSPTRKAMVVNFTDAGRASGISDLLNPHAPGALKYRQGNTTHPVQCFPIYSILAAIGIHHVDYFSLDIEGAEVQILETIPYDQVKIDVFSVERRVEKDKRTQAEKTQDIIDILSEHGFKKFIFKGLDIILFRI